MDDRRNDEPRRPRRRPPATAGRVARLAADHVAEMTGKEPEGITSLEQAEDGRWTVGVEVVETHRIPDTTDILAVYEAELDPEGELLAYRRVDRYIRCQVGER
ncbi:gas vesicle protein [Actinoallomurus sp. NBC_01490]|uniref:gas vesicle protein GvpO n=1 Tax=Actinoallomurus sp. NBC_01490 TaxID=2903557 RepID=UPI002E33A222|nr:gas vesicle protein [Actinoallomurus sp. NBC_01490]